MNAARQPLRWGTNEADERLARYERVLGIPLRADETSVPTRLTGRETQESPVTDSSYILSEIIIAIRDVFLILIVAAGVSMFIVFSIWLGFQLFRPLVEPVFHLLNLS